MNLDAGLECGRKPASRALKDAGLPAWAWEMGLLSPRVPTSSSRGSSRLSPPSIGSRSPFPCVGKFVPPARADGQKLTPRLSSMGSVGSEEDGEAAAVVFCRTGTSSLMPDWLRQSRLMLWGTVSAAMSAPTGLATGGHSRLPRWVLSMLEVRKL